MRRDAIIGLYGISANGGTRRKDETQKEKQGEGYKGGGYKSGKR